MLRPHNTSWIERLAKALDLCTLEPKGKTEITDCCKLTSPESRHDVYGMAVEKGLLEEVGVKFKTTEKGCVFLMHYRNMLEMLE